MYLIGSSLQTHHFREIVNMNWPHFASILLFLSGLSALPVVDQNDFNGGAARIQRSPTFHKKHGHGGLLFGGIPSVGPSSGGNTYVTNINNYGPAAAHEPSSHHGHGLSVAGSSSSASAGGHGGSAQAQSQAVAFSLGPFSAALSQSQALSGGRGGGGVFDYFDY